MTTEIVRVLLLVGGWLDVNWPPPPAVLVLALLKLEFARDNGRLGVAEDAETGCQTGKAFLTAAVVVFCVRDADGAEILLLLFAALVTLLDISDLDFDGVAVDAPANCIELDEPVLLLVEVGGGGCGLAPLEQLTTDDAPVSLAKLARLLPIAARLLLAAAPLPCKAANDPLRPANEEAMSLDLAAVEFNLVVVDCLLLIAGLALDADTFALNGALPRFADLFRRLAALVVAAAAAAAAGLRCDFETTLAAILVALDLTPVAIPEGFFAAEIFVVVV